MLNNKTRNPAVAVKADRTALSGIST